MGSLADRSQTQVWLAAPLMLAGMADTFWWGGAGYADSWARMRRALWVSISLEYADHRRRYTSFSVVRPPP